MVSQTTAAAIKQMLENTERDGLLAIEGIRKEFPGVVALDDVRLRVRPELFMP